MSIQAGKLNHKVTIQSATVEQDESDGNVTEVWGTFAEVWANVRFASGKEFMEAGLMQTKIVASVQIRYLTGITTDMRIIHGSRVFNIEAVLPDPDSGLEGLMLPVSEVLPNEAV